MKRSNFNLQPQPSSSCFKRIRLEERDSPDSLSSDTESILSVQFKSTDYAEDTEDTSTDSSVIEDEGGILRRKFVLSTSEESEIQEIADLGEAVMGAVLENNLDIGLGLADTSSECSTSPTSNSDVDPGLPRSDYVDFEKCTLCKSNVKDSSYPYCFKCFKFKKSFFPPRPKKKRRKVSLLNKNNKVLSGESSENPGTSSEMILSSQDSGIGSSQGFTEPESYLGKSPQRRDNSLEKNMCEICCEKKRNGLFLHGNSAHLYGCYQCAKTSWYSTGGCPLCRKKVKQIIKFLNSDD